ncbi:MAG: NAD(P)H-dependent oxidoreductase subunit E [Clostridia bacterium]|nr:NAD(P)H-dependent oxidoreductase subunit E [Clostridia bacterium]
MDNGCLKNDEKYQKLLEVIEANKNIRGSLIRVLHEAQGIYGYLPVEVQKTVAEGLNVPLAEVYGVVTFYTQFSTKPKGEYKISVCLGTACYVKGSDKLLDKMQEELGISVGDCTEDGKFSIEACRCIGACGLAPVFTINSDVYGKKDPDDVPAIIAKYKN